MSSSSAAVAVNDNALGAHANGNASGNGEEKQGVKRLTARQEQRLIDELDAAFLELSRGVRKRHDPSTTVPTLSSYLLALHPLLSHLLSRLPPTSPTAHAYLLRLTLDLLSIVPLYRLSLAPEPLLVRAWLDTLDDVWGATLRGRGWDLERGEEEGEGEGKGNVGGTERVRLRSVIGAGKTGLEVWVRGEEMRLGGGGREGEEREEERQPSELESAVAQSFSRTLGILDALDAEDGAPVGAPSD